MFMLAECGTFRMADVKLRTFRMAEFFENTEISMAQCRVFDEIESAEK